VQATGMTGGYDFVKKTIFFVKKENLHFEFCVVK